MKSNHARPKSRGVKTNHGCGMGLKHGSYMKAAT